MVVVVVAAAAVVVVCADGGAGEDEGAELPAHGGKVFAEGGVARHGNRRRSVAARLPGLSPAAPIRRRRRRLGWS